MTAVTVHAAQEPVTAPRKAWPVLAAAVAGSGALAAAEALLGAGPWHSWTLIALVAVLGGLIAANDIVSLTLPNRYTAAFAAAAGVQAIATAAIRHDWTVALWAGVAGVGLFAVYVVFGLLGWAGFGDAKFAAGLGVAAAVTSGLGAFYVFPVAIVVAGIWRLVAQRALRGRGAHPHGPALVIATLLVMLWNAIA